MKKIIITESEKKQIREMYGIINEDINQELLKYGNDYIDNHDCNEIYDDLVKFQSAVNSGDPQMSDEDKKELDDNLKQMNTFKGLACGRIKKEMKKSFSKQAEENPEKLKIYMCWFATNITNTNLTSCGKEQSKNDDVKKSEQDKTVDNKPIVKPQPTIKTDIQVQNKTNTNDTGSITSYEKTKRPSMKVDPFADNGTYSKESEGFKNWFEGVYKTKFPDNAKVEIKNNSAEVTIGKKKYIYSYNKTVNSWDTDYEEKTIK